MPLLFSYGTLQQKDVQVSLFGRVLAGSTDTLPGFRLSVLKVSDEEFARTSGKSEHAVVAPDPTGAVFGAAFELTEQELANADRYEPVEYTRVLAKLESGRQAWVYVQVHPPLAVAGQSDA